MTAQILPFPRPTLDDAKFDAAMDFILDELAAAREPAGIDTMRAVAERELASPKTAERGKLAAYFLAETRRYK